MARTPKTRHDRRVITTLALPGAADSLARWQTAEGRPFLEALDAFLRGFESAHTRRSYGYAVLELLAWCRATQDHTPLPDEVSVRDAALFAEWLRTRNPAVLAVPPTAAETVVLGLVDRRSVGATEAAVALEAAGLADEARRAADILGSMARRRRLRRHGWRSGEPRYALGPALQPERRDSTVAARLSALSAFWTHLGEQQGNRPGDRPLLTANVWRRLAARASRLAPGAKRATRVRTTPGAEVVARLLATAYRTSHGADALQAAWTLLDGRDPGPGDEEAPGIDLRDRVVVALLVLGGLRVGELAAVVRSDIDGETGLLTVRGKGGRTRTVKVPRAALAALSAWTAWVETWRETAPQDARRQARADAVLATTAPLAPALGRWGLPLPPPTRPLGRTGVGKMLRRRAEQAGIQPGSGTMFRVHPHGIRHLAAHLGLARGVALPVIQAVLGHLSLATTGQYVEEHDPAKVSLVPEGPT